MQFCNSGAAAEDRQVSRTAAEERQIGCSGAEERQVDCTGAATVSTQRRGAIATAAGSNPWIGVWPVVDSTVAGNSTVVVEAVGIDNIAAVADNLCTEATGTGSAAGTSLYIEVVGCSNFAVDSLYIEAVGSLYTGAVGNSTAAEAAVGSLGTVAMVALVGCSDKAARKRLRSLKNKLEAKNSMIRENF